MKNSDEITVQYPALENLNSDLLEFVKIENLQGNKISCIDTSSNMIGIIFEKAIDTKEINMLIDQRNIVNIEYYEDSSNRFSAPEAGYVDRAKRQFICGPIAKN
jgi:hypothetical protein